MADLTLYSSEINNVNRDRIDEANKLYKSEMEKILDTLGGQIDQGLGLYSDTSNQAQFNQAFANAQDLVGQSVQPGQVDFSRYNPYMDLGDAAAREAGLLSGAIPGYSSEDIYNRYLNNAATRAQMDQGTRQINASNAATGSLRSGSVLRALQNYGQGIAAQGIGTAQDNLYKLAGLGADAANRFATNLLNKYQTDQQAQLGSLQNRVSAVGQQANLLNARNSSQQNQLSFLSNLASTRATLAEKAASQRASSLANSASTYKDTYGMGYGGIKSSLNTKFTY